MLLVVFAVVAVLQPVAVAVVFVLEVVAAVEVVQPVVVVVVVELMMMDEVDLESFVLVGFSAVDAVELMLEPVGLLLALAAAVAVFVLDLNFVTRII